MRKIHSLAVMVGVAALAIGGTMAAASASPSNQINQKVNAYNYLHLFVSGTASASWQKIADSPLDTNGRALVGTLPDNNINTYVNAYSQASRHINKPVASIKNLSYDFQADKTAGDAKATSEDNATAGAKTTEQAATGDILKSATDDKKPASDGNPADGVTPNDPAVAPPTDPIPMITVADAVATALAPAPGAVPPAAPAAKTVAIVATTNATPNAKPDALAALQTDAGKGCGRIEAGG